MRTPKTIHGHWISIQCRIRYPHHPPPYPRMHKTLIITIKILSLTIGFIPLEIMKSFWFSSSFSVSMTLVLEILVTIIQFGLVNPIDLGVGQWLWPDIINKLPHPLFSFRTSVEHEFWNVKEKIIGDLSFQIFKLKNSFKKHPLSTNCTMKYFALLSWKVILPQQI